MAHVVCQPCIDCKYTDCKYTDCVTVCPVDCFREAERRLFIDPDACIDCELCVPECPVQAIFRDLDVPAEMVDEIALNAREAALHPPITQKRRPLADR